MLSHGSKKRVQIRTVLWKFWYEIESEELAVKVDLDLLENDVLGDVKKQTKEATVVVWDAAGLRETTVVVWDASGFHKSDYCQAYKVSSREV